MRFVTSWTHFAQTNPFLFWHSVKVEGGAFTPNFGEVRSPWTPVVAPLSGEEIWTIWDRKISYSKTSKVRERQIGFSSFLSTTLCVRSTVANTGYSGKWKTWKYSHNITINTTKRLINYAHDVINNRPEVFEVARLNRDSGTEIGYKMRRRRDSL